MKKNGFTLLEILTVLFIVGSLTILGLRGFQHTRASHQVDSLIQELTLLRTAIMSYKESHGRLPTIEESALSCSNFDALRPFWYPFHPENSKVIEGGEWWGKFDSDEDSSFLAIKKDCEYVAFDVDILKKKLQKLCRIHPSGNYFYILSPWADWDSPGGAILPPVP